MVYIKNFSVTGKKMVYLSSSMTVHDATDEFLRPLAQAIFSTQLIDRRVGKNPNSSQKNRKELETAS